MLRLLSPTRTSTEQQIPCLPEWTRNDDHLRSRHASAVFFIGNEMKKSATEMNSSHWMHASNRRSTSRRYAAASTGLEMGRNEKRRPFERR